MKQLRSGFAVFLSVAIAITFGACGDSSGSTDGPDAGSEADTATDIGAPQDSSEATRDTEPDSLPTEDSSAPDSAPQDATPDTTPPDTNAADTAPQDSSEPPEDTAAQEDTAPQDTAQADTEPQDTTPEDTTPEDTSPEDTTPGDTSPEDTAVDPQDTAVEDTTPEDTTPEDTSPDTAPDDTTADLPPEEPPLFDMDRIRDPVGLDCIWGNRRIEMLEDGREAIVWNVSYNSWEVQDGELTPILIRGYAALLRDLQGTPAPAVVWSHGLAAEATVTDTMALAGTVDALVLSYTGPGEGTQPGSSSDGLPASADGHGRLFDTEPDVRGSWMWGHSAAAMRALTCLEGRPEVDGARLGISGYSLGGLTSLIVAAEDDRVDAAVVVSSATHWDEAVAPANAWQGPLLTDAGLTTEDTRWRRFVDTYAGPAVSQRVTAPVLLVSGSSDGFFPITALRSTLLDLPDSARLSLIGNLDHGCFLFGIPEDTDVLAMRSAVRVDGGQRLWFRRAFQIDPYVEALPVAPSIVLTPAEDTTRADVQVDEPSPALTVEEVLVWWSDDNALTWSQTTLTRGDGATWSGELAPAPNALVYAEVIYRSELGLFAIASEPSLPENFTPRVLNVETCMP